MQQESGQPEVPNNQTQASGEHAPAMETNRQDFDSEIQQSIRSQHEADSEAAIDAPSLNPANTEANREPFYRRNPLTVAFSVLLAITYALTTFPNDFKGPSDLVVMLGGFYPPAVQDGQWWRFITATLMHGSPGHLFNNVAGLLIFGNLLEPVIGSWRLFGLYIVSALAGLGLSYFLLPTGMTYGASTIDYGLIGTYLALILILRYRYDRTAFFREFRGAVIFVLLFVFWNSMESATVNLWGHVGGFFSGVVFALWFVFKAKARRRSLPQG